VKVLRLSREGRASGGAERTLLLISHYREHEKLFRNVNFKKKSLWELIVAENPRESGNHRHSLFASIMTTAVLREMTEGNAQFTGKLSSSLQV